MTSLDPPFWGHHSEEEAGGNRKSDIHEGEENGTKSAPYQVNTHTHLSHIFWWKTVQVKKFEFVRLLPGKSSFGQWRKAQEETRRRTLTRHFPEMLTFPDKSKTYQGL